MFSALTKACKVRNDIVTTRLPIEADLLHMIIKEIVVSFSNRNQPYLTQLYKTMFITGYYGLLRVGEMTDSPHNIKAMDVHVACNKDKILICLRTSKTNSDADKPQIVKMTPITEKSTASHFKPSYCPFSIMMQYLNLRRDFVEDDEPLFIFRGRRPDKADEMRRVLKRAIKKLGINDDNYNIHSLRIGRACQLQADGINVQFIKQFGRWKSNIYKTSIYPFLL